MNPSCIPHVVQSVEIDEDKVCRMVITSTNDTSKHGKRNRPGSPGQDRKAGRLCYRQFSSELRGRQRTPGAGPQKGHASLP